MLDDPPANGITSQLEHALHERYRLVRALGEGGMAVVFEAKDLKHGRPVAIKVLRPELSAMLGADRFLREIQVTAQLQHPHILPLYDSGAAGSLLYYVMPLVQGETLRDRLRREHELPVPETVALARAVAGALDYAHRQGVLHRDIKPENILLHDGQPMLADFGIALAISSASGSRLTQTGLSIGTPTYMSPEQMSGERALDARSDVYALGCVVYECLAGVPPFTGSSAQAVVAAVMMGAVKSLPSIRPAVPRAVAAAVHRALAPLPADRFSSGAAFASALTPDSSEHVIPAPASRRSLRAIGWIGAAIGLGLILGAAGYRLSIPRAPGAPVRHWNLILPPHAPVALAGGGTGPHPALALSPDGARMAYAAAVGTVTMLAVRSMSTDSVVTLPGTEGAYQPFFSPDGKWIGYFSGNLLRKVAASGGDPVTVTGVDRITGALWTEDDRILVFENEGFELHRVSPSGASIDSVVNLSTQFGAPDLLPGGAWAVGQLSSGQLALLSLASGTELAITRRGVLPLDSVQQADLLSATSPRWLPNGYLVYASGDGVLMAMPFDGKRHRVLGAPQPVLRGLRMEAGFGYADFAIARDGTMLFIPGRNQLYVDVAVTGAPGRLDTLPIPRGAYTQPRLSPDGSVLAVQARNPVGGWDILLVNLQTGVRQVLPVQGNYRPFPASWLPDGRALMIGIWDPVQYISYGARIQSLESGRSVDIQLKGASYMNVAPDGRQFVFSDWRSGDLFLRSLGTDTTRRPIPARGFAASFSPDGRWVAWGGVDGAVAVSPVPPTGAIYPVANQGKMPVWTHDGAAIIYRNDNRYYRVPVSFQRGFHAGRAELLAEGPFLSTFAWNHDIAPGDRLLVLLNSPDVTAPSLSAITGFPAEVDRLSRTSRP